VGIVDKLQRGREMLELETLGRRAGTLRGASPSIIEHDTDTMDRLAGGTP
jgi:hypothetical protein